tara:strand:- start:310 stop:534 length:225 start_codon:yes stop_codon:yes gene_type:complete
LILLLGKKAIVKTIAVNIIELNVVWITPKRGDRLVKKSGMIAIKARIPVILVSWYNHNKVATNNPVVVNIKSIK